MTGERAVMHCLLGVSILLFPAILMLDFGIVLTV